MSAYVPSEAEVSAGAGAIDALKAEYALRFGAPVALTSRALAHVALVAARTVAPEACGLCKGPATGLASIGDVRYCHGDEDAEPTCYEVTQRRASGTAPELLTTTPTPREDVAEQAGADSWPADPETLRGAIESELIVHDRFEFIDRVDGFVELFAAYREALCHQWEDSIPVVSAVAPAVPQIRRKTVVTPTPSADMVPAAALAEEVGGE